MSSVGARKQLQSQVELLLSLEAHTQLFQSIDSTSHVEVYCVLYSREKSQLETVAVAHLDSVVSCGAKDEITGHQAFRRFGPASLPKPIARRTADMRSDLRSSIVAMNAQSIPPDLACLIRQQPANPRSVEHNCSSSSKQTTCLCSYSRL